MVGDTDSDDRGENDNTREEERPAIPPLTCISAHTDWGDEICKAKFETQFLPGTSHDLFNSQTKRKVESTEWKEERRGWEKRKRKWKVVD